MSQMCKNRAPHIYWFNLTFRYFIFWRQRLSIPFAINHFKYLIYSFDIMQLSCLNPMSQAAVINMHLCIPHIFFISFMHLCMFECLQEQYIFIRKICGMLLINNLIIYYILLKDCLKTVNSKELRTLHFNLI